MSRPNLPPDFVKLCRTVTAKRPKTVINHIHVKYVSRENKSLAPVADHRRC
jgi:hypothetical protein